jgi:hypothetical protein
LTGRSNPRTQSGGFSALETGRLFCDRQTLQTVFPVLAERVGNLGQVVRFQDNPFSWSDAMQHDPGLKLVVLTHSSAGKVWALRFDRAAVKLTPMAD